MVRRGPQRLVAGFGLVIGIGLVAQLLGSSWYMGRMLPGTVVGDQNLSGLSLPQARAKLVAMADSYHIGLDISGQQYNFTPQALGVSYDPDATLSMAYKASRSHWWTPGQQPPVSFAYSLNSSQLAAAVGAVADRVGTQPVDAGLILKAGEFETVADKDGFTLDRASLAQAIESHLASAVSTTLTAAPQRVPAAIGVADLASSETAAKQLMAAQITLTYGANTWTPSAADIGSWLTFAADDNGNPPQLVPAVDQTKLRSYVAGLAKQVDVAAVTQLTTVTPSATTISRVGVNGTAIDQTDTVAAISAAVMNGQPLDYTITDSVVPFKTTVTNFKVLDLPSYIEVNLSLQHLWVWQDGNIIYDSPVTSGATGAGFPTAEGLFHIYDKKTNTWLNGEQYGPRYNYDDFVKYWMPFYQGYGLHDASWRNGNFGETSGPFGYWRDGSHGCINLPDATAAWLYNWSVVGTPVWVHE